MNAGLVIRCLCLAIGVRVALSALRHHEPVPAGAGDGVVVRLGRAFGPRRSPQDAQVLGAARLFGVGQMPAETLAGREVVCLVAVALLTAWLLQSAGVVAVPGCIAAMFWAPTIPLRLTSARVSRARRAASAVLPQALELTAAWMASGQSVERALEFLSTTGPIPMRALAHDAQSRIHQGINPTQALRQSATLSGIDDLGRVAASLDRARQLGVPAAESVHDCASGLRSAAHAALARRAGRAGPAATLVTAMVIAPACVAFLAILLVGGAAVGFSR